MMIYVGCWPILAWIAGKLIPAIGKGDFEKVVKMIGFALIVFLIQKIFQFGQDILLAGPALRVSQSLRKDLFQTLQKIQLGALEKLSSGDVTYRLTEDADRVGEVIYKTIQDTTPSLLQLITVFGYMVWLDWKLSLATLILAPIVAILVSFFGARVLAEAENSQKKVSSLAGLLSESINGLPLVRAFTAEEWLQKRFDREVDLHRRAKYKTMRLLAFQHPVIGFIEAAGILCILVIGALQIKNGVLDSQGFSSYFAALLMLIDPISHLTTNFNELKQGQASLRRLSEIEKQPLEFKDSSNSVKLSKVYGKLTFKNLYFSYENDQSVLNDVSVNVEAGTTVALVGPSGAGKSTLFSLLMRFNDYQRGDILLDGKSIKLLKTIDLRRQIGLVPQRMTIFSGTIEDAIKFGRDSTEEEVITAAKLANAHDFIITSKSGYKTQIEERGLNLSGGQLQRIAIARAVLCNPSLLLLDEATSSLDAEAESAVQIGLRQVMHSRTVLVIAHRLATVQEADQIIVLDRGRVIETGSHKQLIGRAGKYRDLCERQLIRNL